MRNWISVVLASFATTAIFLSGCAHSPSPQAMPLSESFIAEDFLQSNPDPQPPRKRVWYRDSQVEHPFPLYSKMNPIWWLGNADNPVAPDWYRPEAAFRDLQWHLRNPFHNFTKYTIGIADRDLTRYGVYPSEVFPPFGGWNFTWTIAQGGWFPIPLPFISYNGPHVRFYLGWRNSGNFGAKLNLSHREATEVKKIQAVLPDWWQD